MLKTGGRAMRATMIDAGLDEVQTTIEQQAARLQQAGMAIAQAHTVLGAIPTNAQALITAINTEGTAEQKARLAGWLDAEPHTIIVVERDDR